MSKRALASEQVEECLFSDVGRCFSSGPVLAKPALLPATCAKSNQFRGDIYCDMHSTTLPDLLCKHEIQSSFSAFRSDWDSWEGWERCCPDETVHFTTACCCCASCLVLANEMQTTIFCCSFTAPRTSLAHLASKPRTQTNVVNVRFCCSLPCRCITRFQSGEIECNEHCFAIVREWNDFVQIFIPLLQQIVSLTWPCFLRETLLQAAWSCNASNLISKWCSLAV